MRLKLTPTIVRLALLALVALLSTAAISFAASGGSTTPAPAAAPTPAAKPLIRVPDVPARPSSSPRACSRTPGSPGR